MIIADDLSLRKQNMIFVEKESENNIHCTDQKDRSDWLTDNNNPTSRASSSPTFRDFVEARCHNTLTCEDE